MLKTVVDKLNTLALTGSIPDIIDLLKEHSNKLTMREGKVYGILTFAQLREYMKKFISNKMNREEELDLPKNYFNKLSHALRYIDGISAKCHLMLSYVLNKKNNMLYIRDDGTMMSLLFGDYYTAKRITGKQLEDMINEIISDYDVDLNKTVVLKKIVAWVGTQTEQQKNVVYSLEQILVESGSMSDFIETRLAFEINVFTMHQHTKDEQNANLQPNPWVSHNFYKASAKALDEYDTTFMGNELYSEFVEVPGFSEDTIKRQGKSLFRKYAKDAKRAEIEMPFYMIKSCLLEVDSFDSMLKYNDFFVRYNSHTNRKFADFWYKRYDELVSKVSYKEMQEFVSDFKKVIEGDWSRIATTINQYQAASKSTALEDLKPWKNDFATYIVFVTLALHQLKPTAFHRTPSKNIEGIRESLIKNIINCIDGTSTYENVDTKTWLLFKTFDGFKSWKARFQYVWEPAIKQVYSEMTKKKNAESLMTKEIDYQKTRIESILQEIDRGKRFKAFSHQDDEIHSIHFDDHTKCMAGLHCVARDNGGTAEDGIIWGLTADNMGDWKYADLNTMFDSPADYWKSLGDRNTKMLKLKEPELGTNVVRGIEKFIDVCYAIYESGLNYGYTRQSK